MNATQDTLDFVAADPTQAESREAIRRAVIRAAAEHRGLVHAAGVREFLPAGVNPSQVGATICALVRLGYLVPTGRFRPNGGTAAGNRSKMSEVRRLIRLIPPSAVAS